MLDIKVTPSFSNLSVVNFEKGESSTSADNFFRILERLNVTLDEFYYLYTWINEYDNPYILTTEYIRAYYNGDLERMKELSLLSESKYEESKNEKYKHYKAITNLLACKIEQKEPLDVAYEDFVVIKNYLIKCNSWGYYEIILFVNSIIFFSDKLIDITYKKTKENLTKFNNLVRHKSEVSILILNILEKKIKTGNIQSVKFFYKELQALKEYTLDDMYLQTMLKYFGAIIDYIDGDLSKEDEILHIINIFEFLNMEKKSIQCRELFKEVKQSYR